MPTTEFGHEATPLGQPTERSLAEILGSDPEKVAERMREQMNRIRAAERAAERETAGIRLH